MPEEDDKRFRIMRAVPFFASFNDGEVKLILESSRWLKCEQGEAIVREGDGDRSFFVILKGGVEVQKKTGIGSIKKTITVLGPGQCFGEMSLLTGTARSADVIASRETYLLKVDAESLNRDTASFDFKSIQFKFYKVFCEILAVRLNNLDREFAKPFY